ncbi:MAG: hypothetical protein IJK33_06835 [Clostridia bacterium]|nr:hypothetical protein [Clostridia bacterium]
MKQQRTISIVTAAVFVLFIFALTAAFIIIPDKAESPTERRYLQQFPELNWESFSSGKFGSQINDYFNDQFPLREAFLELKTSVERLLLKGENNGVLIGKNGQLAVRYFEATDGEIHVDKDGNYAAEPYTDSFYAKNIEKQFAAIKTLESALAEKGVPLYVLLPPRTVDVACSAFTYPKDNSDALIECVRENAEGLGHFIDMYDIYRARYDNGEYVYYKTDHHWTTLGAYYAYAELCKAAGYIPPDPERFVVHTAAEDFIGTTAAKAGMLHNEPDTIEYWTARDNSNVQLKMYVSKKYTGEDAVEYNSLFDLSYLESYDKYGMFLSGTNVYTEVVHEDGAYHKKALLLKDSFGHSLAQFLACRYDLTVLNIANLSSIKIDPREYDCVIICFNLENLITTNNLLQLRSVPDLVD